MKKKRARIIESVGLNVAYAPFRFFVPVCRPCTSQYNSRGHNPFLLSSASGDGRVISTVVM
jgi:hypothetical protein